MRSVQDKIMTSCDNYVITSSSDTYTLLTVVHIWALAWSNPAVSEVRALVRLVIADKEHTAIVACDFFLCIGLQTQGPTH